jgi:hypothetical protein
MDALEGARRLGARQSEVKSLIRAATDGDPSAAIGPFASLITSIALGVPALGAFAEAAVASALARSAWSGMQKAIGALEAELEEEAREAQVRAWVTERMREVLAPTAPPGAEDVHARFAAELGVHVARIRAEAGAIGARFDGPLEASVHIGDVTATGKGSVGLQFGRPRG